MTELTSKTAAQQPFLGLVRDLVQAYNAFTSYDARALREAGLTVPQADVLFTLGNTDGMTCREIGERTLITKGTLTGVLDRMEKKGLLRRVRRDGDRRCVHIELTATGTTLFDSAFTVHIAKLKQKFDALSPGEIDQSRLALQQISSLFK
ncbi:MAG: MarR family winged helix-turn-helix transcriptional regulator [Gammaproteobacteria bacterium]|nr:MarR family winged helix-turn-helix transcriptional regulator [Gammaproteobacteria bacterium]